MNTRCFEVRKTIKLKLILLRNKFVFLINVLFCNLLSERVFRVKINCEPFRFAQDAGNGTSGKFFQMRSAYSGVN